MKQPQGFNYNDNGTKRHIYYMDLRGKDPREDIARWRIHLYYASHLAATAFFSTEREYLAFIENLAPNCYSSYDQFKKAIAA